MKKNDWKDRLNIVYSTNPDFRYDDGAEEEEETPEKKQAKTESQHRKEGKRRKNRNRGIRIHRTGRRSERTRQAAED